MLKKWTVLLLCWAPLASASSSSTSIGVGALRPLSLDADMPEVILSTPSGDSIFFQPVAGQQALTPGETYTQSVTLQMQPPENAPSTQSSTLSLATPQVSGYHFACKINGQLVTSAALGGSVKLEFIVQVQEGVRAPLSGQIVATITSN
ncbi:hypothetical protein [Deinococcus roseus]|uniref:Uncharacterized protein n=1 Tax=Deinococcus roseus TaxID=392414 RepID=A0ABQ2CZ09_9DEIO|nr:hypothetical protein [Deinococcus roseus]GGJ28369.1 hypothetical protein GCM10008938_13060 [Deinococcus roseus]